MAGRRSNKYYAKNEYELMTELGLKPTARSGAGWIEKEDGQNDMIIAQLKSSDAESIGIKLLDLHTLEHNAVVSHKIPLFVIQYLQSNEVYFIAKLGDFPDIAKYIECGKCEVPEVPCFDNFDECEAAPTRKIIKSSTKRNKFWDERQKEFDNVRKNSKNKDTR